MATTITGPDPIECFWWPIPGHGYAFYILMSDGRVGTYFVPAPH